MADRQWPATILGTAWMTYDPDDGWTEHDNPADAERTFGVIVDHLRDEASDGWHESADSAAWGIWIPIERLRLHAKAWPDDDTEDGERCRDAGWDAILDGRTEPVALDAAAIDYCVRRESAAFSDLRDRIATMEAERDEARAEVERLRASRARWSVAAGIAADTLCPQCGLGVRVDEDGCCRTCGNGAMGAAVDSRSASIREAEAADVAAGVSNV